MCLINQIINTRINEWDAWDPEARISHHQKQPPSQRNKISLIVQVAFLFAPVRTDLFFLSVTTNATRANEWCALTDCGSLAGPAPKLMVCFCSMMETRSCALLSRGWMLALTLVAAAEWEISSSASAVPLRPLSSRTDWSAWVPITSLSAVVRSGPARKRVNSTEKTRFMKCVHVICSDLLNNGVRKPVSNYFFIETLRQLQIINITH